MSSKETEIIQYIKNISEKNIANENSIVKIGDDATLVYSKNHYQLITTDASVEGTHFNIDKISPEDIGWKCAISNISDIAAMGGKPENALVSIGIREKTETSWVNSVMDGIKSAMDKYGANIVGGDIVKSTTIFINITLTGLPSLDSESNPVWLSRKTAKDGDYIAVTGNLGASLMGLSLLDSDDKVRLNNPAWSKHVRPEARIETGVLAVSSGIETGMDISDGLINDLEKISLSSKHDIVINIEKIPVFPYLQTFLSKSESVDIALNSGEEYELILIGSKQKLNQLISLSNVEINIIGKVTNKNQSSPKVKITSVDGKPYLPKTESWKHFYE